MSLRNTRGIDRLIARSIVINMTNGESIRGILVGNFKDSLVIKHAIHLGTLDGQRLEVPIDGEATVPRERIAWIQNIPPSGTE